MKDSEFVTRSILSGVLISIGVFVYGNAPNKIAGAFLFSIALLTILSFGCPLYTGAVGYYKDEKDVVPLLLIFSLNIIGCCFSFLLPNDLTTEVFAEKVATPLHIVFIKSLICGVLIYIASESHNRKSNHWFLITIICVMAFMLSGCEHSIADICMMFSAKAFSWYNAFFIMVVAFGNAFGAILTDKMIYSD